jgi:hypothetical protein
VVLSRWRVDANASTSEVAQRQPTYLSFVTPLGSKYDCSRHSGAGLASLLLLFESETPSFEI